MSFPKIFVWLLLFSILFLNAAFAQERDTEGSRDHPLLPRMPNFYISGYIYNEYESHEFYDAHDNEYVIRGRKWIIDYTLREGFPDPGQLRVRNYYIDVVQKIGGSILFDQGLYMKAVREGKEIWIEVWISDYGNDYTITAVEKAMLRQKAAADYKPAVTSIQKKELTQDPDIQKIEQALALIKENRDRSVANLDMIVRLVQNGYAAAFPDDPSRSPDPPAGVVSIPYPNIGMAGNSAKGPKKVKTNTVRSVALKDDSYIKISESDEIGAQTAELTELIQRRYKQVALKEEDKAIWKKKLMMYQDQAATIVKALDRYVEEAERLLEESKKESGFGIK